MSEPAREPLRCDLCDIFEADAMLLDGRAVCTRCAHSLNPNRQFATWRGRLAWFWGEYRSNEALPLWWVLWRWAEIELRMRLT